MQNGSLGSILPLQDVDADYRGLGMAMRLSFDLGLHIDVAPYVAEGTITADEAELRRIVFWGTYSTDQYANTYSFSFRIKAN